MYALKCKFSERGILNDKHGNAFNIMGQDIKLYNL